MFDNVVAILFPFILPVLSSPKILKIRNINTLHLFFSPYGFSEQLCASELHRRTSISSGEKIVSDLQTHQTAYSRDRSRTESEPDPDRDIELELCALDMEDSDHQEIKSQVGMIKSDINQSEILQYHCIEMFKIIAFFFFYHPPGVFRPGHTTVSGCLPPPPTSLFLSPSLFSCGGPPPNRGSFNRKDRCSPA